MSKQVNGLITWLRQWFDDIYAPKGQGGSITLDDVYPVGSIYMSVNSTNPSTLFGGTWEQIEGRFLLASGDLVDENDNVLATYTNGSSGGSADAVVVEHNHTQNPHHHTPTNPAYGFFTGDQNIAMTSKRALVSGSGTYCYLYGNAQGTVTEPKTTADTTATNNTTGESGTGKNMPPYLTVNVWKRTA